MRFNLIRKYSAVFVFSLFLLVSCNEKNEAIKEEQKEVNEPKGVSGPYTKQILPSLIGYIFESQGGIGKVISYENTSDNKSKYIAFTYETVNGEIESINYHYEGNYNNSELSVQHPFLVLCVSDADCKDCGFIVSEEGTMCGCNDKSKESPCYLKIDHITDFDFYANYHDLGLELLGELGIK